MCIASASVCIPSPSSATSASSSRQASAGKPALHAARSSAALACSTIAAGHPPRSTSSAASTVTSVATAWQSLERRRVAHSGWLARHKAPKSRRSAEEPCWARWRATAQAEGVACHAVSHWSACRRASVSCVVHSVAHACSTWRASSAGVPIAVGKRKVVTE
eukprot:scaffold95399_cov31-Tisochrysis_lutea.AAC.1